MNQKIYGTILLYLMVITNVQAADPIKLEIFDEEEYQIVFTDSNETNSIREYLRKVDQLEKWDRMITKFEWKNVQKIKEILPTYTAKVITPNSIRTPNVFQNTHSSQKEDYIFEFFLSPGTGGYIEYNLHRMITTNEDKVLSFIFAIKIPMTGTKEVDQETVRKILEPNRTKWIAEIKEVKIN
ncbi:hypothetical protein [Leptospira perdikensis]|uniref:Polyketide cyclase n=1 Tax=Leptospira perdikensis TaxID=2484948 RepID=A0A4V3JPC3_9LEPT|nr:hypothetical protein [Leptospira perdikensis]TGL41495.1 hypothetical protein EHQ49_07990 [Leptospira perdikensis]